MVEENEGLKNLSDYSDELKLKERLKQDKRGKEALKTQLQRDLSAKQTVEELEEYAPLADEICDSPSFREQFCKLYRSRKVSDTLEIVELVGEILSPIDLPFAIGGLIALKITKKIADVYCKDS